jgi:hypothetical protein
MRALAASATESRGVPRERGAHWQGALAPTWHAIDVCSKAAIRCAVGLPNVGEYGDVRVLVDLAQLAERAGWDGGPRPARAFTSYVSDHGRNGYL